MTVKAVELNLYFGIESELMIKLPGLGPRTD